MRDALRLSLPLTLWLVSFSAVYGLHALVCTTGWAGSPGPGGMDWGRIVLVGAMAAAVALQAAGVAWLGATAPGFVRRVSLALAVVACAATVWTALPTLALPLCEG